MAKYSHLLTVFWVTFLVALSLPSLTKACTCTRDSNTLEAAFASVDNTNPNRVVAKVRVKALVQEDDELYKLYPFSKFYRATIRRVFAANCETWDDLNKQKILIRTGLDSGLCGVDLDVKQNYLLVGNLRDDSDDVESGFDRPVLSIGLCDYQNKWGSISKPTKKYIRKQGQCRYCPNQACGFFRHAGPEGDEEDEDDLDEEDEEEEMFVQDPELLFRAPNKLCPDGVTLSGPSDVCRYDKESDTCTSWVNCPTCETSEDCNFGQFCSAGECRAYGTCGALHDCFNPNHGWVPRKPCTGYWTCAAGRCDVVCGADECPPDTCQDNEDTVDSVAADPVEPVVVPRESTPILSTSPDRDALAEIKPPVVEPEPCLEAQCRLDPCRIPIDCKYDSCVPNPCEGCAAAYYFDAAGERVCQDAKPPVDEEEECQDGFVQCFADPCQFPPDGCEFDSCQADYCGGCNARFFNADGELVCQIKKNDDCNNVNCLVNPCDFPPEKCTYATCEPDYCGGCNAIFYGPDGERVCEEPDDALRTSVFNLGN